MSAFHRVATGCIGVVLLLQAVAVAAQPTQAQQNALRSNCRSDFMSHCAGVQPGGAEALQCLQRNAAKLSLGCQSAVNTLAPSALPQPQPAGAPTPPSSPAPATQTAVAPPATSPSPASHAGVTPQQRDALRQFCGADYMAKCGNVPPATAAALQCLQGHAAELSPNCRGALALLGAVSPPPPQQTTAQPSAPATAPAPPAARPAPRHPAPHATAAAAAARPTAQQQAAIRQSCQSDFMAKCSGVQPGGADALRCLQRNSAQLSLNCRSAVAAIGGGASHATTAAPHAAAAAAPAAMPTSEQQSAIKRTCQRDFIMNCRGVQPGGPEALACLQRNAGRLSTNCRTSLAAVTSGEPAPAAAAEAAPAAARPAPAGPLPLRRAIRRRIMEQQ